MCVNLSGKLLERPDLPDQVRAALIEADVAPRSLRLEITETILMESTEAARDALAALRELGIVLVLDDFGTGYSSLSYLNQFSFDSLKIDRSLVQEDDASVKIMQAVAGLAHGLGLTVVAEGVETATQLARARAIGCEFAQGFHLSPPLDGERITELLARHPRW
jgi:EAL domain-containing protein (putative c-di-GMP-specific phosphodiesterase class I)